MFSKLQKNVSDVLDLPPDVTGEGPKVTIFGKGEILVENFLEIVAFEDQEVRINTTIGDIVLNGKSFVIITLLQTELRIQGELYSLKYEEGAKRNV
ncbi:MAG: sporulation protein [Desulfitobacterium hafniense]|nr:sporulation protein [Desulfitobacterium hafniense]